MEKIVDKKWYRTDVFEPVTEVPDGYFVWPIGRHNFQYERCVPLAKLIPSEYDWQRNVDIHSLKYIMVESEELALRLLEEAVRHGCEREKFYKIINA